jgi:protein TonB
MLSGSRIALFVLSILALAATLPAPEAAAGGEEFVPPRPISSCLIQPSYPEAERTQGIEGTVILKVDVLPDGTVGTVTSQEEVAGHPAFTDAAIAAIGKWCFEPARKDGQAVECTIAIPVRFKLGEK